MTNYEYPLDTVKATDAEWKRYIRVFNEFMNADACRFCGHHYGDHVASVGQPHFFRLRSAYDTSPEYADNGGMSLTKVVVACAAELEELFCYECAESMNASQVVCWMKSVARGEIVGIGSAKT